VVTIAQHAPDEVADAYGIPADTRVVQPRCLDYDEAVVRRRGPRHRRGADVAS
jgi:hypothetical protein